MDDTRIFALNLKNIQNLYILGKIFLFVNALEIFLQADERPPYSLKISKTEKMSVGFCANSTKKLLNYKSIFLGLEKIREILYNGKWIIDKAEVRG